MLFGSQARGDATLRSDIDLLIVPKNSQDGILDALREVKSGNKINATVISLEAFKNDAKKDTLFHKNIKSDSIILHISPELKEEVASFLGVI